MLQRITVRQALIHDLDKVAPLFDGYRQFYGKESDLGLAKSFLLERFKHSQSIIFIAFADSDKAVGFTQLYPSFSSVRAARIFMLNDLFVAPKYRRNGVASKLLAASADHARAVGAIRMVLSTATTNTGAQELYTSLGWQRDEAFLTYQLSIN